jgi:hypothetical protein
MSIIRKKGKNKMRELTGDEIDKFASRPGVNRIAVENFLMSMTDLSRGNAELNCGLDTELYKWSWQTRKAILDGIEEASR